MLACAVCRAGFYGRSDAVYCSAACRQKAHRARRAESIAELARGRRTTLRLRQTVSQADLLATRRRAHAAVDRARELCGLSAEQLHRAQAMQQRRLVDRTAVATVDSGAQAVQ